MIHVHAIRVKFDGSMAPLVYMGWDTHWKYTDYRYCWIWFAIVILLCWSIMWGYYMVKVNVQIILFCHIRRFLLLRVCQSIHLYYSCSWKYIYIYFAKSSKIQMTWRDMLITWVLIFSLVNLSFQIEPKLNYVSKVVLINSIIC